MGNHTPSEGGSGAESWVNIKFQLKLATLIPLWVLICAVPIFADGFPPCTVTTVDKITNTSCTIGDKNFVLGSACFSIKLEPG